MSDEFDKLRAGLKSAPPAADPAKAETLRRAMENFDRHQETATKPRPSQDRPERAGVLTGVRDMFTKLTTRGALAATASIAALGIGVMIWPSLEEVQVLPEAELPVLEDAGGKEGETRLRQADAKEERDVATVASDDAMDAVEPVMVTEPVIVMEAPAIIADETAGTLAAPTPGTELAPMAKRANGNAPQLSGYASQGIVAPDMVIALLPEPDTEAWSNDAPNPVKIVAEEPGSTFSIDTDTASYSGIRSSLTTGYRPP
ncbi:MAG: von Willebrand factor type A domain-containing protein, partial [Albidovulum sp.]|uniref:VWA domain-containing protein n=1 Tax=Albidovulum sp. TaxID=1872424 RepID=UPI003CA03417